MHKPIGRSSFLLQRQNAVLLYKNCIPHTLNCVKHTYKLRNANPGTRKINLKCVLHSWELKIECIELFFIVYNFFSYLNENLIGMSRLTTKRKRQWCIFLDIKTKGVSKQFINLKKRSMGWPPISFAISPLFKLKLILKYNSWSHENI